MFFDHPLHDGRPWDGEPQRRRTVSTLNILTDISVIIISFELFVILLVPGIILFFVVRGILRVAPLMRRFFPQVQNGFRQAAQLSETASHRIATPFIAVDSFAARLQRIRRVL
jgi:hypothetical protein